NTDTVTILMTQAETAATTAALGNDVTLKWDAPGNILSINTGRIISNISSIIAGDYEIITGAGRADFIDGSVIKSTWFDQLRTAGRHIDDSRVVLEVRKEETLDYDYTFVIDLRLDFKSRLTIPNGRTLTINSPAHVIADSAYFIFNETGTGAVIFTNGGTVHPEWWGASADSDGTAGNGTDNLAAFDSSLASLVNEGGEIRLLPGKYRITDYWDIRIATLVSDRTIKIKGQYRSTAIILDNDIGTYALVYDDGSDETTLQASKHVLILEGFKIGHTKTIILEETFHPGTGLYTTARDSLYTKLRIVGFTFGLHAYAAWKSAYHEVSTPYNQKGITIDRSSFLTTLDRVTVSNSGDDNTPANGYGLLFKRSSGVISAIGAESSRSYGIIIENSHGVNIVGGNIETYTNSRSILLRGLTGANYADIRNWTTGVTISGIRFWNALGIEMDEGVGWVEIDGNSWTNNAPGQIEGISTFMVRGIATDKLTVKNINYTSNNNWLLGVEPEHHRTPNWGHAFTKDGLTYQASIPTAGTYLQGYQIINSINPSFRWVIRSDGTFGTLNITGTIVDWTTDPNIITLSTLVGIYPGVHVNIVGIGDVIIGNVDTDTDIATFSPAAGANVAGAAVT
ncbi:hypothetical protein LCGC14_2200710, partial [marine sediment metagenome]